MTTDDESSEQREPPVEKPSSTPATEEQLRAAAARRHFRWGWFALFAFASLGLVLESLNGLRVGWYLDVSNETRRTMFRLAHAHGTLLAVVNLVFSLSLSSKRLGRIIGPPKVPSACLTAALVLVPAGFFAGGVVTYDGDPGVGVMLVPVGALLFIIGALLLANRAAR